jgi:hypothetical protein
MFLPTDFKITPTPLLKKLCKIYGIKKISRLKKDELTVLVNKHLAAKVIQRHFRNHFYKNATDHITLEPTCFPCFIYRTKSGKNYFYSHDSIIKYIMKTGNTRDPMTREEYSDQVLSRLDTEAKRYYPSVKYRSTYKIKKNLAYARRIKNRENEIMSYQLRMDELKELILFIIESGMQTWNLGTETLLIENVEYNSIGSFISSVFHELKMVLLNLRVYEPYIVNNFQEDLTALIKDKSPNLLNLI